MTVDRDTLIDKLWEASEPLLFIGKDDFAKNMDGWDIVGVEIDGELSFITVTKGPAFHFHSLATGRQLSLKRIRGFLKNLIDRYGYAETKTPLTDERQHRFNMLLGFVATGDDEFDRHYRIERVP